MSSELILKELLPGKYTDKIYGLDIDLISVEDLGNDTGVIVFVKAWKDGNPLGFGPDGTIETEKIRIFNPSLYVPDGTKRTIQTQFGEREVDNFRLDAKEALQFDIAHTVSLIGKEGSNIIPGSVGRTTSIFNPTASAVDGLAGTQVIASWPDLHGAAGDDSAYSVALNASYLFTSYSVGPGIGTHNGKSYANLAQRNGVALSGLRNHNGIEDKTSEWARLYRTILMFDTSAIPDGDTITGATLSIYGGTKVDGIGIAPDLNIYAATPASTTAIVDADFTQIGTIPLCDTPLPYASQTVGVFNDFTLNAAGLANIDKTGISKFGTRNANYDVANVAPVPQSSVLHTYFEYAGYALMGGTMPKLSVEH